MIDIKDLKYRFGQKYNLPESLIDDSLLPLLLSNEVFEDKINTILLENTKVNQALSDKMKGSIKPIYYENSKIAFIGNLSIYAVPSLIFCLTILLIWWALVYKETHTTKYENLERLSKIILVRDSVYFIPKENFKMTNKGVILVEK